MTDPASKDAGSLLRRLVDGLPSMLAYWDQDMRCRFANRAYERWFGVDPDALVGTTIPELLGPELFALNEPHIRAALKGETQLFERVVPGPGGVKRHGLVNYVPDIIDGKVLGFMVLVTETTPLKQTEAALRESELNFRRLVESSPFAVFLSDREGQCHYTNARWREITGMDLASSLGTGWQRAVHPEDRREVRAAWDAALQSGSEFDYECNIVRPDGVVRRVRARARPEARYNVSTGNPELHIVGAVEDVTEKRLAEQRLRLSEAFLDRAGRVAGVGGWEINLKTRAVTWSDRTRRIHEVSGDYFPTLESAIQFFAPEARPLLEAAIRQAMDRGVPWDLELPFVTATGRSIWVRAFGEVEYEAGEPVRLVGAFQDITEHRQRRVELQREQVLRVQTERHAQELDRLLQERNQMLDVMAHEVRQPLNNASAALQSAAAALAEAGEEIASLRLKRAQAVMGKVLASIDNTLAVASLLARPEPIHRDDTDIDTVVSTAIADLPAVDRQRVHVERNTKTRTASMDMSLMRLALRNLLANALRHGPAGSPVVVRLSDSDDPLALLIDVSDTGSGIAGDLVPRLFERGTRGTSRGAPQGLGLGLYIVRRVMELHLGHAELLRNGPGGVTMRLVIEQSLAD